MRLSQKPSQRRSSLHMSAGVVAFKTLSLTVIFDSGAQAIVIFLPCRTVTRGVPHPGDIAEAASIRCEPARATSFEAIHLLHAVSVSCCFDVQGCLATLPLAAEEVLYCHDAATFSCQRQHIPSLTACQRLLWTLVSSASCSSRECCMHAPSIRSYCRAGTVSPCSHSPCRR